MPLRISSIACRLSLLLLAAPALVAVPPGSPAVGAIRWDGWHSDADSVGRAVAKCLTPAEFQFRLPFFAQIGGDGTVAVNGDRAEVMEREIGYARQAHLGYWAFLSYEPGSPMNRGLELYLASPHRAGLRFCVITEASRWRPDNLDEMAARYAQLMAEPGYQTTAADRPLLYLLDHDVTGRKRIWKDDAGFRRPADALRAAAQARGLPNPYLAVMTYDLKDAKALLDAAGLDAISAYAFQGGALAAPYGRLPPVVENFWEEQRRTGAKVVPLAMSGWDRRPRIANPVPWEHFAARPDQYYETATADEVAQHVAHAVAWCGAHPDAAEARAVIVYAWNEHDEGGWLCPTLRPDGTADTSRIEALGQVLETK